MAYHTVIPLRGFRPECQGQIEFDDGFVVRPVAQRVTTHPRF